jgi:hypothetical protein
VQLLAEAALAEKEDPEKGGLEEEGEGTLHAKVWAIMSPAKAEKAAQVVPNWNFIGMPAITSMTKVMAKILPQKRTALL